MRVVNVGEAKSQLSKLLALAEAGEDVEIARDGVPVVRLVPVRQERPGVRFLTGAGSLAGRLRISTDAELTDAEIDEMLEP